jgi:D-beta-D-heptose 7-phosphate kinase/D-beta-D-heptose 1-phosphate adenosyltransferase
MSILVIGDVMLDRYYWGDITRISPEVPVPVCNLRDVTMSLGGAANVAHNLVNLGEEVALAGVVGDDDAGRELRGLLAEKNVTPLLVVDPERPTIVKTRVIGNSQHIVRIDTELVRPLGAALGAELEAKVSLALAGVSGVVVSDYAKGVLLDATVCRRLIGTCAKARVPVFVDPKAADWSRYAGATCVTPNKKELLEAGRAAAVASNDVAEVARALMDRHGFEYVLVTLGPEGLRLFSQEGDESFTSAVREVFDVSGAGDTVVATFAASYCAGLGAAESARRANAAAGIVVGKVGTYPVSRHELDEALGMERYRTDKRCSLDEALHRVAFWRSEGNSVVFTNGCFDLLHAGHVLLFQEAKKLGDKLVVAVNSDASVRRIKGAPRPVLGEKDRLQILTAIEHVDMLLVFDEDEPTDLIAHIRPDVLAKGSDYAPDEVVGADVVKRYGGRVERIAVLENTSVSGIVKRMKGAPR